MNNTTTDEGLLFDEPVAVRILRLVLYPLTFLIGVIGNLTVCSIVLGAKNKTFRSAKGYFILNLALSDLMVLFLFLPFDLAYLENGSIWPFGFVPCKLINVLNSLSVTVSGSMLICIGYERYKAIVNSLMSRLSRRKALVMVVFSWVYSCVLQIPFVFALTVEPSGRCLIDTAWWPNQLSFNLTYIMALIVPQFVIPAFCIILFYVGIVCHLRKAHKLNYRRGIYTSVDVAEKREKQNRKTTKLLTGLVLVYAICILPGKVILLSIMVKPALLFSHFTRQLYEFARLLTTANSCFNPILYTTISHSFRDDLRKLFSRISDKNTDKFLQSLRETPQAARRKTVRVITVRLESTHSEREDEV